MKHKNLVKVITFFVIFSLLLSYITHLLKVSVSSNEYKWMSGIYNEKKNSLDAVYLGSSNCYTFWNPNVAFSKYGISVYSFTCSSQPLIVAEYLIKEARKTQKNAVFVVNINTLGENVSDVVAHRVLDFLPLSENKLELIDYICDLNNLSFAERLEYYFPIIRFHNYNITAKGFTSNKNYIK